jgi:hypothetical protein
MKKLILIITVLGIYSCTETPANNTGRKEATYIITYDESRVQVVIIDSCEYLYGPWGNATVLTHKGNCKNQIHPTSQKKDEVVERSTLKQIGVENLFRDEKHFDCTVESAVREKTSHPIRWYVTTECGISFYSDNHYPVGSVLKGFKSPKHK